MLAGLSRLDSWSFYRRVLLLSLPIPRGPALVPCTSLRPARSSFPGRFSRRTLFFRLVPSETACRLTRQGLEGTSMLTSGSSPFSLSFLVIYTTPFFRDDSCPEEPEGAGSFSSIIALSYQYILIFAKVMEDLHLARKSKLINNDSREQRLGGGTDGLSFRRTKGRCEEVFSATSRGLLRDQALCSRRKLGVRRSGLDRSFVFP